MNLQAPSGSTPIVEKSGRPTAGFQGWLANLANAVNAASSQAAASASSGLTIVATGGLQRGGSLADEVGIALYRAIKPVAQLPSSGNSPGDWAYALDGRKPGKPGGAGTGVPVFWSVTAWFSVTSGAPVTA